MLLNQQFNAERPLYGVLTTSRTGALPFPALSLVLPQGTVPFFPVATAIQCREVHSVDFSYLAERYAEGKLAFVGELPPAIMAEIDSILTASPYLALATAREILPRLP